MAHEVTVTGASRPVEIYSGETAINDRMLESSSTAAESFRALVNFADDQRRLMIEATRWIDRFSFAGTPAGVAGGSPTKLKIPRVGVLDASGIALTEQAQLQIAEDAVVAAMLLLIDDGDAAAATDQGSNIKRLKAGSAEIEFHGATSVADGTATSDPQQLLDILAPLLAGGGAAADASMGVGGGFSTGTSRTSVFDYCDLTLRTRPY